MIARVFPGYELLPALILSHLRTRLPARARVLDVGCGTGTTLASFARHQPQWSLVGVDPAEPMVAMARAKAGELGAGDRLTFVTGTLEALPEGPPFQAATLVLVEHLLPDDGSKLRLLEGIARRLEPGGWLALAGLHGDLAAHAAQEALEAWLQFLDLRGLPDEMRLGVRRKATEEDSLVPEARLRELLAESGFSTVERFYQAHLLGGWLARKAAPAVA